MNRAHDALSAAGLGLPEEEVSPRERKFVPRKAERPPASLPPALWKQVWGGLDEGFFPTGHPELHLAGKCKCGELEFQVDGTLAASFYCHCHMCRKYWSQFTPTPTLWVQPATAVTVTKGKEHASSWTVEKLSRNLRGQAYVQFCKKCGTNINVTFSDPGGTFTLMWPNNFAFDEWGDTTGKGDKARHGYSHILRPRFHAHYENRNYDVEDSLPKLADIWLPGMPLLNASGEAIGTVQYPLPGFERGWEHAPTAHHAIDGPKAKL